MKTLKQHIVEIKKNKKNGAMQMIPPERNQKEVA